jgi:hypothetical protein
MSQTAKELPLLCRQNCHARIVLAIRVQSDASMKRLPLLILLFTVSASAQIEIGPRISNYSTKMDMPLLKLDTGRVSSFGLVGGYRTGAFLLDWTYDHDTQNGVSLVDVIVDTGDYTRDRGEVTIGYGITPLLDLQGGARLDQIRLGGIALFGNPIGTDLSIDHQALVGGFRLHSAAGAPAGFYVIGRGLIGTAKFKDAISDSADTTGYRGEVGIPIRLGQSNWYLTPGAEYEHLEAKDHRWTQKTNRFFLSFVYSAR